MASTVNVKEVMNKFKETDNAKAVRGLMIGLTALVVIGVSLYSAVIYIQFMDSAYPNNQFRVLAYLGAVANVLLMIVLLVGKFTWFKEGSQTIFSWLITGSEVIICVLNLILSYQLAHGNVVDGPIAVWYQIAPASPVFSMVGALILLMTSSEMKSRHEAMKIQEQQNKAELTFAADMHSAKMEVQNSYLEYLKSALTAAIENEDAQYKIKQDANNMLSSLLSQLSGVAYTNKPAPKMVDSTLKPAPAIEEKSATLHQVDKVTDETYQKMQKQIETLQNLLLLQQKQNAEKITEDLVTPDVASKEGGETAENFIREQEQVLQQRRNSRKKKATEEGAKQEENQQM